jgi:hypothetical protein
MHPVRGRCGLVGGSPPHWRPHVVKGAALDGWVLAGWRGGARGHGARHLPRHPRDLFVEIDVSCCAAGGGACAVQGGRAAVGWGARIVRHATRRARGGSPPQRARGAPGAAGKPLLGAWCNAGPAGQRGNAAASGWRAARAHAPPSPSSLATGCAPRSSCARAARRARLRPDAGWAPHRRTAVALGALARESCMIAGTGPDAGRAPTKTRLAQDPGAAVAASALQAMPASRGVTPAGPAQAPGSAAVARDCARLRAQPPPKFLSHPQLLQCGRQATLATHTHRSDPDRRRSPPGSLHKTRLAIQPMTRH